MRLALKELVRDGVASLLYSSGATRPDNAARLTIATFHRVLPADELRDYPLPGLAVTPEELGWLLRYFTRHFECGPLAQVHERWLRQDGSARPPLAITFDDGQLDNFRHARPVLEGLGLRATFFAVTEATLDGGLLWHDRAAYAISALRSRRPEALRAAEATLGGSTHPDPVEATKQTLERLKALPTQRREEWIADATRTLGTPVVPAWDGMMTFEQLRSLADSGHEIGSHSHTHPILTGVPAEALDEELARSRRELESRLQQTVTSLCYPNGNADARVVAAAQRAGYRRAVTTRWGWNPRGIDPFQLKRFDMQGKTSRSRSGELSAPRVALRMTGW